MNAAIAQRLVQIRTARGYSQEDLAAKVGVSPAEVARWETAEASPAASSLITLADLYGITLDELLRQQPVPPSATAYTAQPSGTPVQPQPPYGAPVPPQPQQPYSAVSASPQQQPYYSAPMPSPQQQPYYGAPVPPQQPYAASGQQPDAGYRHRHAGPWSSFPYPVLCVVAFLLLGFFLGAWHPGWVIFLTIPVYYWIARIIENDPTYRENHRS